MSIAVIKKANCTTNILHMTYSIDAEPNHRPDADSTIG